ncbi:FlaD/FlaE family flagellar protein [Halobium salinum]|uniref:FlaD/FlaE family flagellar protein n=1 Tax=Halobium salinum TaxID=1364940 RepID=A0ABD5PH60_9EURY|nr:FlaD/FlaE family flagellar protein [Halobium salinum]
MSLDPRDYDLTELRSVAGGEFVADPDASGDEPTDESTVSPGERLRRRERDRELLTLAAADGDSVERPFVDRIPVSRAAERVVFDWLDFLLTVGGETGARDALTYYERVEWLGTSARESLERYLDGFPEAHRGGEGRVTLDDHRESLAFVARIRAFDAPRRRREALRDARTPADGE